MRRLRRVSAVVVISLLLLSMGNGVLRLSPTERAAAPYLFDLVTWEVSHVADKWLYKAWSILPWNSKSREERLEDLEEYLQVGREIETLEREVNSLFSRLPDASADPTSGQGQEMQLTPARLDALRDRQSSMKPGVEETLESELSAVISREGFSSRIGLIWPPVDVALTSPPRALVVSPRDRIERLETVLLEPDIDVAEMEDLEERILREQNLAALVQGIGGIATYPTIVSGSSLLSIAETAAHEWLHAFWFFRPLGWNYWSTPKMTTLNETAASIAGDELGRRVYEAITGEVLPEEETEPKGEEEEGGFDFDREMRQTRLTVDEMLAEGKIEEAEAYMEERRQLFVRNGFLIRKLNQAFFAFQGTYANSPASVSPIGGEAEELRSSSDSVGDFIRTIAGFGSYQEFLDHLDGLSGHREARPERGLIRALQ